MSNGMEDVLEKYRALALESLAQHTGPGGFAEGPTKTASAHTEPAANEKVASLLDEINEISDLLLAGEEVEKVAASAGAHPAVSEGNVTATKLNGVNPLGKARTTEKNRPLQGTPGGAPTAVHTTQGKDKPTKTASVSESEQAIKDRILAQFGVEKTAASDQFPNAPALYTGTEGPGLNAPGTELISTNARAVGYNKREAKRYVVPSLSSNIGEPALSSATDPVAQRALTNASEAGVKTAGLNAGSIRGLLLGGGR